MLIAIEGIDRAGKTTQVGMLQKLLGDCGHRLLVLRFPTHGPAVFQDAAGQAGRRRNWTPEVIQLMGAAHRYESRGRILEWLKRDGTVICDAYTGAAVATGEAAGLSETWIREVHATLPEPDLTVLLEISPTTSAERTRSQQNKRPPDLPKLHRLQASYTKQSSRPGWHTLDATKSILAISDRIQRATGETINMRAKNRNPRPPRLFSRGVV